MPTHGFSRYSTQTSTTRTLSLTRQGHPNNALASRIRFTTATVVRRAASPLAPSHRHNPKPCSLNGRRDSRARRLTRPATAWRSAGCCPLCTRPARRSRSRPNLAPSLVNLAFRRIQDRTREAVGSRRRVPSRAARRVCAPPQGKETAGRRHWHCSKPRRTEQAAAHTPPWGIERSGKESGGQNPSLAKPETRKWTSGRGEPRAPPRNLARAVGRGARGGTSMCRARRFSSNVLVKLVRDR